MNGIIAIKKNNDVKPTEVGHAKSQAALGLIGNQLRNQSWNYDTTSLSHMGAPATTPFLHQIPRNQVFPETPGKRWP